MLRSTMKLTRGACACPIQIDKPISRIRQPLICCSAYGLPSIKRSFTAVAPKRLAPAVPTFRTQAAAAGALSSAAAEPPKQESKTVKIAALGLLFLCSTFNYTILQNLKDSIVVTAVGAEALPFLEAYGVLPMSVVFFLAYGWLTKRLPDKWVYQAALSPFLAFYALFGAVLYPMASVLHPTHLLEPLRKALPEGLVGLAGMLINWSYSLFFCIGELWGGVAISLLFWGLADEVCSMGEAKDVYPLLGIIANVGLVVAGAWIKVVNNTVAAGNAVMGVQILISTILAVSAVLMVVKTFVYDKFVPKEGVAADEARRKKEARAAKEAGAEKPKGGLGDSLGVLKRSPKVRNLAILVVSYFVAQKLFDFSWKAQLRVFYPSPAAYQSVLADVAQWTGVTTMCLMACSKYVFQWGGWLSAALVTPLAMLLSGAVFFTSAVAMQGGAGALPPQLVASLIAAGSAAGMIGRVVSRAPKYSLFDPAKEMVFITMSKEEKNEGKATVDLVGAYFGKSGASWIMQIIVLVMGSMTHAMPLMGAAHVLVTVAWINATMQLGKLMKHAEAQEHGPTAQAPKVDAAIPSSPAPPAPPPVIPSPTALSADVSDAGKKVGGSGISAAKPSPPSFKTGSTAVLSQPKPLLVPTKVGEVVVSSSALLSHDDNTEGEDGAYKKLKAEPEALKSHLDE